jgi:hypothetical protein
MPDPPPVTSATLPSISPAMINPLPTGMVKGLYVH